MSVQEIQSAIRHLPDNQIHKLSAWLIEYCNQRWDKQIEEDAKAGRLDKLINQAKEDYKNGLTKPL